DVRALSPASAAARAGTRTPIQRLTTYDAGGSKRGLLPRIVRFHHAPEALMTGFGFESDALELGAATQVRPDRILIERRVRAKAAVDRAFHELEGHLGATA